MGISPLAKTSCCRQENLGGGSPPLGSRSHPGTGASPGSSAGFPPPAGARRRKRRQKYLARSGFLPRRQSYAR